MPACCPSGRQLLRPLLTLALEPQMTRGLGGRDRWALAGWLSWMRGLCWLATQADRQTPKYICVRHWDF